MKKVSKLTDDHKLFEPGWYGVRTLVHDEGGSSEFDAPYLLLPGQEEAPPWEQEDVQEVSGPYESKKLAVDWLNGSDSPARRQRPRVTTTIEHKCASCGEYSFSFVRGVHVCHHGYRWRCQVCGAVAELVFSSDGLDLLQKPTGEISKPSITLLQMRSNPAIAVVVRGVYGDGTGYYYENTCPENIFLNVVKVFGWGEEDPHQNPINDEPTFGLVKEVALERAQKTCYSVDDESEELRKLSKLAIEITGRAAEQEEKMRRLVGGFSEEGGGGPWRQPP